MLRVIEGNFIWINIQVLCLKKEKKRKVQEVMKQVMKKDSRNQMTCGFKDHEEWDLSSSWSDI